LIGCRSGLKRIIEEERDVADTSVEIELPPIYQGMRKKTL
jgi:hypothetical protein